MKKSLIYACFMLLTIGFLASCSTAYKSINSGAVANVSLEPLKPDRYIILEEVEGEGKAAGLGAGGGGFFGGMSRVDKAKRNAEYQAISKVEGADMLLAPRFEIETFSFLFIFSSAKVKVKAKAVRVKATSEK